MRAKVRERVALRRALEGLPADLESTERPERGGSEFRIRLAGRVYRLRTLPVGEGWPSEVRRATEELGPEWPRDLVATARRFSDGALRILSDLDANWADETGRSRIVQPPGLSILKDRESPKLMKAERPLRWSRSTLEIAEVLLQWRIDRPSSPQLRTGEVAALTDWSLPQVSQVMQSFDDADWTASRGSRSGQLAWRELIDPGALLDAWAEHVGRTSFRTVGGHVGVRDLVRFAHMQLGPALNRWNMKWALTGWAGLELLAPFATTTPLLQVYVAAEDFDTSLDDVMRDTNIRAVSEGARIEFRAADFNLIRQKAEPDQAVCIASTTRVYADLLAMGGRAADSAAHLREVKIGF